MFNSSKYKNDYAREHYARLSVFVPIEDKEKIEKYCKNKGFKSLNAYINELIRRDMNEETNEVWKAGGMTWLHCFAFYIS